MWNLISKEFEFLNPDFYCFTPRENIFQHTTPEEDTHLAGV